MAPSPDWELWEHGPLDTAPLRWRETYTETYSPCEREGTPTCVDWDEVAPGTRYPKEFEYQGLSFMISPGSEPPIVQEDSLKCGTVQIRFPEPVGYVSIAVRPDEIEPGHVTLISGGQEVDVTEDDSSDDNRSEFTFSGTSAAPLEIDAIRIQTPDRVAPMPIHLKELCYRTTRELTAERERDAGEDDDRTPSDGAPVLQPDTEYKLTVGTKTTISKGGETKDTREKTSRFHFRTGTGPGTNESAVAFADTPLNDLATYIDHTLPEHGARQAYYGYDLTVGFNEGYVERMYDGPLGLRVRDRNGTLIADPAGERFEGFLPLLPPGLLTRQAAEERQCQSARPEDATRRPYFGRSAPRSDGEWSLRPNRTYTVEVVTRVDRSVETLHSFQFNTSKFPDLDAHLQSGLVEDDGDERQTTHTLPSDPTFDTSWTDDHDSWTDDHDSWTDAYDTRRERVDDLRENLGEKLGEVEDNGRTGLLTDIADLLAEIETAIDDLDEFNEEGFEILDEPLSDRPLPPVLEFVQKPVGDHGRYALLVESPEPLDWHRLELKCDAGDVRVVWNGDKTRAFVTVGPDLWLGPGEYEFTFSYGPGKAPELPPLWRDSSPVDGDVHCTVRVTNE